MVLILDGNLEVTDLHVGVISVNDRFKEFDYIESSHKSDSFPPSIPIFLNACATCSELPSNIMQLGKILSMFSSTVDTDFESEARVQIGKLDTVQCIFKYAQSFFSQDAQIGEKLSVKKPLLLG